MQTTLVREAEAPPAAVDPLAAAASTWKRIALQVAGVWLATRLAFVVITYFAVLLLGHEAAILAAGSQPVAQLSVSDLVNSWDRWDADNYLAIITHGYAHDLFGPARTAFFPLFPLLAAVPAHLIGAAHALWAAMAISNLAALGAFAGIYLLAVQEGAAESALTSVLVFAAYPLAFFTFAAYADGLLVALVAFGLLFARRGMWLWAAACAFLAGLTRPTGIILVLPLAWEYGRQRGWWDALWSRLRRQRERRNALAGGVGRLSSARYVGEFVLLLAAVPAAIGLYAAYCWRAYGDPLIFLHVQAVEPYGRVGIGVGPTLALLWHSLTAQPLISTYTARTLLDVAPLLFFTGLTAFASLSRRMPFAFTLLMLGVIYLSVNTPAVLSGHPYPFAAVGRYFLPAVPLFLLLGRWAQPRPWLTTLLVGGGFMLLGTLTALFVTGGYLI